MAKRPLGLAKSAKAKKLKQQTNALEKEKDGEKQEADLNIDLDEDIDDEALAEIYGLFKTFDASPKSDPKMAMGLVHECDALLRERQKLPARFHLCYGLALLTIAGFQDNSEDVADGETPEEFIKAAIDRLDVGLEEDSNDQALKAAKATALVAKLEEKLSKSKSRSKTLKENEEILVEAKKLAESAKQEPLRFAEAVYAIQQLAVSLESSSKLAGFSASLFKWCSKMWPSVSESEAAQKIAWQGLGELALSEGQNAVAEIVGEDDDDENDENDDSDDDDDAEIDVNSEAAQSARKILLQAVDYLSKVQGDSKPAVYAQIAEAKISLGNITANESKEQNDLYTGAVKLLKKAQRLGAGDYHELIESLEDED